MTRERYHTTFAYLYGALAFGFAVLQPKGWELLAIVVSALCAAHLHVLGWR